MQQPDEMMTHIKALNGYVLSIYLNTDPSNEQWKIVLKNGLKKTSEYVEAANPDQKKDFEEIYKKANEKIKDSQAEFANSLVCFATRDDIYTHPLQITVEDDFSWEQQPKIEQLQQLIKTYPQSGVMLLQRDQITLITTALGRAIHEEQYVFDLETEHWRPYKGLGYGNVHASSANHRDQYERRLKENQERWYKAITPTIEKYAKQKKWHGAHLAGPPELTNVMKDTLNLNIIGETTRNYSGKSADIILENTLLATK